jgi:hypothetical protein
MQQPKEDLRPYQKFGMSLLQFMLMLGTIGIVATIVLHYLFY